MGILWEYYGNNMLWDNINIMNVMTEDKKNDNPII